MHVLVMAKAPVPGRVKTRLCPPLHGEEAARYAQAALIDTLDAVRRCGAERRILALEGAPGEWLPPGFTVVPQRGATFNERLANAWAAAGGPGLQIGMDTPQVSAARLDTALSRIEPGVALLGPAVDGGWWALGLPGPASRAFDGVPMSCADTRSRQATQLEALGYRVEELETLIDVDHFLDACHVARQAPWTHSARYLTELRGRTLR